MFDRQKPRRKRRLHGNVRTLILSLVLAACTISCHQESNEVKIGLAVNLSGYSGISGEDIRDGAVLAVRDINRHQKTRRLRLLIRDDKNTPKGVKEADTELIEEGCPVIIGHSHSENTLIAYPIVTGAGRLLVTAFTATSKLSRIDDLFLRTSVDNLLYSKGFVKLFDSHGIKDVALVLDVSNPSFSKDLSEKIKKDFKGVAREIHIDSAKSVDWQFVVRRIVEAQAESVLMITEVKSTAILAQMLRQAGYDGRLFATIWALGPYLASYGGEAVEGLEIVSFTKPRYDNALYRQLEEELSNRFSKDMSPKAAMAYELVYILADAINRCGRDANDPVCLKKKLLEGNYSFLLGRVRFDLFGDVDRPLFAVKIEDGKFELCRRLL